MSIYRKHLREYLLRIGSNRMTMINSTIKHNTPYIPIVNIKLLDDYITSAFLPMHDIFKFREFVMKLNILSIEPVGKLLELISKLNDEECLFHYQNGYNLRSYRDLFSTYNARLFNFPNSEAKIEANGHIGLLTRYETLRNNREISTHERILYVLTIKSEYLKYYKQCIMLNIIPDVRIYRLLIDKSFDHVSTRYPNTRTAFRKYVKKVAMNEGIEVEYLDNINNTIFNRFEIKASSPTELKQKNKEFINELCTIE